MKKIFLAICFSLLMNVPAHSKVTEVLDQSQLPKPQVQQGLSPEVKSISADELEDMISERIKHAVVQSPEEVSINNASVIPSDLALQAEKEAQKSTFQKIYENALRRIDNEDKIAQRKDISAPQLPNNIPQQQQDWNRPNYPVIRTTLPPDNKSVLVPAVEHIPYLMNNIEILPDGVVKFSETVVVVANGQKLKEGLSLALPKYLYSRTKEKHNIDYTLISVMVNDQNIPYKTIANLDTLFFVPQEDYTLEPGVYTYKFEYLADNLIWDYGDHKELYWDITGSRWNMVISRAGATLNLIPQASPLWQVAFAGHQKNLSTEATRIINPTPNVWGILSKRPLFIGEGLHLVTALPKDAILPTTWDKKAVRFFNNFADLYISIITFAAIIISFLVSWKYIRKNKGQIKFRLKKTPVLLRYLAVNRFDFKSFECFLAEMYRKNIIDIQQSDGTILLIKRTDNLKSLNKYEQKALHNIFANGEAVFNVTKNNLLKIRRAAKQIEKDLRRSMRAFLLKLNSGYIFFSMGMLLLGEAFIATFAVNTSFTFMVLASATAGMYVGIYIFMLQLQKLWGIIIAKTLATLIILFNIVIMAAVISPWSIIFILLSLIAIRYFTSAYGQRNGLLKSYINELAQSKENLRKHHDSIVLGREITNQQALILALDMEDEFLPEQPNEFNKLPTLKAMLKTIGY